LKLASIILSLVAIITSCVDKRKQKKRDRILEEELRNSYGEPSPIQKKSCFSCSNSILILCSGHQTQNRHDEPSRNTRKSTYWGTKWWQRIGIRNRLSIKSIPSAMKRRTNSSYRRLGLAARPLTIYTSGGVEKFGTKVPSAETAVKPLKVSRSEGKIQRNPDGTTTIIYPDSDEEMVSIQPELGPETVVVKGERPFNPY
jgi:hypothetical protein